MPPASATGQIHVSIRQNCEYINETSPTEMFVIPNKEVTLLGIYLM